MKIEIQTGEELSEQDKGILLLITGHQCPAPQVVERASPLPPIRKKVKDLILEVLDKYGSMEALEISKYTGAREDSVRVQLAKFKKEKIVDTSTTRPVKYFLTKKGDDELQDALKNAIGTPVSNF